MTVCHKGIRHVLNRTTIVLYDIEQGFTYMTSSNCTQETPKGNKNPYIKEEQTTQLPKKKDKRTNNNQQNIHIKLKTE